LMLVGIRSFSNGSREHIGSRDWKTSPNAGVHTTFFFRVKPLSTYRSATCTVTFELFSLTTEASTTASFVYLLRLCLPLGAAWSALPFAHEDKWSSNNNCVMLTACRPLKDLFGFTRESHVQLPWAEHKELTNFLTPIAVTVRPRHYSWTYIKPAVFFS